VSATKANSTLVQHPPSLPQGEQRWRWCHLQREERLRTSRQSCSPGPCWRQTGRFLEEREKKGAIKERKKGGTGTRGKGVKPVRIFWKASSTFEASKAEVSINIRPFSAEHYQGKEEEKEEFSLDQQKIHSEGKGNTGKLLGLLGGNGSQVPQIALVSHKHDHDVGISVVTKLLQPPGHVLVGLVFCDVVHQKCANSSTVIPVSGQREEKL